ncbi:MAG: hypothetical protein LBF33_00320 [Oscillospiraceae bacterium]|jgi:hypothetical protein|nr:hypothetical protein [Oscillospiraceae bacterium]
MKDLQSKNMLNNFDTIIMEYHLGCGNKIKKILIKNNFDILPHTPLNERLVMLRCKKRSKL